MMLSVQKLGMRETMEDIQITEGDRVPEREGALLFDNLINTDVCI